MRSPSPSARGRSRSDRWLESGPSSAGSAGPRPSSYLQALCGAPPSPAEASQPSSSPAARPPLRSEICRVPMDDARDDWLLARGRKHHRPSRPRHPRRDPGDAPRQPPSWLWVGECPRPAPALCAPRLLLLVPRRFPRRRCPTSLGPEGSPLRPSSSLAVAHAGPCLRLPGRVPPPFRRPAPPLRRLLRSRVTLRVALPRLASVAGRRLGITRELVYNALRTRYGLAAHEFSVHIHADDNFLIQFSSAASHARVAAGGLRIGGFRLLFTPWSRSRDAALVKARFLISIEITGIPDHAWHRSSAEFLLSPFRWVENLAPETRDASDMSVFHLTAWTTNPVGIPRSSELLMPESDAVDDEADQARAERLALGLTRFPVQIHVVSSIDYHHTARPLRAPTMVMPLAPPCA
ncbi:hypothetical protein ZWY2020_056022 [Hordeum vulgare]|nr:hypothetical protein ZWY2020_056022 [Hordeum vulgare]